jgi:ATP-dependent DNA helicase DinG
MRADDDAPALALVPNAPILVAGVGRGAWLTADGEVAEVSPEEATLRARNAAPIVVHAPATARRLGVERFPALDLLELFAFVRPAQFCLPTPRGLSAALGLTVKHDLAGEAAALFRATQILLDELAEPVRPLPPDTLPIARMMARGGWRWAPSVLAALGDAAEAFQTARSFTALHVWQRLAEWAEHAPEPPTGNWPVEPVEARARLVKMLGRDAEPRPQQADYASAVSAAFAPRAQADVPRLVLAEAGTGVGKTLGYLAPATVWAEKNDGPVWISTYTRNLQHQIDRELDRLFPNGADKQRHVVIRKGRENYFCLLNYEEAVAGIATRPQDAIPLGLMARWAGATRDGDMVGGDFPAWLADVAGRGRTRGLSDRRGECIYAACAHFHKCFVEKSIRRARRADIVIANHALVMYQAALGGVDDTRLPTRYVFDEGHHVFDAADGAFSAFLSGEEAYELRRWLIGNEGTGRSRARGLKARCDDLIAGDEEAEQALEAALRAARALPGEQWLMRLAGSPAGPAEAFLARARQQVHARTQSPDDAYSLETDARPPVDGLLEAAARLEAALARLADPIATLSKRLAKLLEDEADTLDTATRGRVEAILRSLSRRALDKLAAWRAMLATLPTETPPAFVDWLSIERIDGRDVDVGLHRHWVDPTFPFAEAVARPAHGVLITSATLTDGTGHAESDWQAAATRTGARHLAEPVHASVPSPFDYPARTRVLVVTDVRGTDLGQLAAAYRALFVASGGGALGLFTAISRLKAVHARIAAALEDDGLPLYAQHIDGLDTGTLIDIFRAEEDACLLGTDAVRDGVDVPGRSLRLIVFDKVPWPRPSILHRARKAAFGGSAYDDMLTRLRLKQAFGRLVRRADDTGVFVMLDSRLPSRLCGAFPPGVEMQRVGLAEAVRITREFLTRGGRD